MKPLIFYVDDEPHNLTVFEASVPDEWEVKTFEHPLKALEALEDFSPSIILTDQRMPDITGVRFLELARKINDDAVRIVVTGYSDEKLIIDSVRKAQVFDYITKPWDHDDLESSLRRAISHFDVACENKKLLSELKEQNKEIEEKNKLLNLQKEELKLSVESEGNLRKELECWVPPFILWTLADEKVRFPIKKNIVGVTFDIIGSSQIHNVRVDGRTLRSQVIKLFSESISRHGGWRESHSGDSAYAHFGLFEDKVDPCESAIAAAREFRVALRGISEKHNVNVECGIALHVCEDSTVDIHEVTMDTPRGTVTQKSFDTTSIDIDVLHKMEKLVHQLPGSNIVLSEGFVEKIKSNRGVVELGFYNFSGRDKPLKMFLIPSDSVTEESLREFKDSINEESIDSAA